MYTCSVLCFFFFKQKTAYEMRISDWSSDVCSSDLRKGRRSRYRSRRIARVVSGRRCHLRRKRRQSRRRTDQVRPSSRIRKGGRGTRHGGREGGGGTRESR